MLSRKVLVGVRSSQPATRSVWSRRWVVDFE